MNNFVNFKTTDRLVKNSNTQTNLSSVFKSKSLHYSFYKELKCRPFNITIILLKLSIFHVFIHLICCFNSTIVRLKQSKETNFY